MGSYSIIRDGKSLYARHYSALTFCAIILAMIAGVAISSHFGPRPTLTEQTVHAQSKR